MEGLTWVWASVWSKTACISFKNLFQFFLYYIQFLIHRIRSHTNVSRSSIKKCLIYKCFIFKILILGALMNIKILNNLQTAKQTQIILFRNKVDNLCQNYHHILAFHNLHVPITLKREFEIFTIYSSSNMYSSSST